MELVYDNGLPIKFRLLSMLSNSSISLDKNNLPIRILLTLLDAFHCVVRHGDNESVQNVNETSPQVRRQNPHAVGAARRGGAILRLRQQRGYLRRGEALGGVAVQKREEKGS